MAHIGNESMKACRAGGGLCGNDGGNGDGGADGGDGGGGESGGGVGGGEGGGGDGAMKAWMPNAVIAVELATTEALAAIAIWVSVNAASAFSMGVR